MAPLPENQEGQKESLQPDSNNEGYEANIYALEAKYIGLLEEKIARLEKDRAAEAESETEIDGESVSDSKEDKV